jgi:squalene cyclase
MLQNEDGGWGLHIESHSNMFCTTFSYICLRMLGVGPDEEACARGRKWILDRGGVTSIPSWGKTWLSVFCNCHHAYNNTRFYLTKLRWFLFVYLFFRRMQSCTCSVVQSVI